MDVFTAIASARAVRRFDLRPLKGMRCDLVISLGHPADPATLSRPIPPSARRPMAELLHRERW